MIVDAIDEVSDRFLPFQVSLQRNPPNFTETQIKGEPALLPNCELPFAFILFSLTHSMHPLKTFEQFDFFSKLAIAASGVFLRLKSFLICVLAAIQKGLENVLQLELLCLEFPLKSAEFGCFER